jgi:choline-glycine betaine transporter
MKNMKSMQTGAFWISAVALVLGAVVFASGMEQIIGLAGTQWAMVAILFAVYAVYFEHASCGTNGKE